MPGWLKQIWISPGAHREMVEELRSRIAQLERDYVEVAHLLINDAEARHLAQQVRRGMPRMRPPGDETADNVVILDRRRQ